jgi:hypothetical protein
MLAFVVLNDEPPLKAGINYIDEPVTSPKDDTFSFVLFGKPHVNKHVKR